MGGEEIVHDVAERVRAIVTDAEERAAEIVRDAEADARRIRERAEAEGRERLEDVRRAIDELQSKLGAGAAAGPASEVEPGPVTVPEPEPPAVPEPSPDPVPNPVPAPEPVPEPAPEPVPEPAPPPDEGDAPAAEEPATLAIGESEAAKATANGSPEADPAAARLVAMNMALDGASREDIEARLSDEFGLADAGAVADDVLALAQK